LRRSLWIKSRQLDAHDTPAPEAVVARELILREHLRSSLNANDDSCTLYD